jgi:hypothetical protein
MAIITAFVYLLLIPISDRSFAIAGIYKSPMKWINSHEWRGEEVLKAAAVMLFQACFRKLANIRDEYLGIQAYGAVIR